MIDQGTSQKKEKKIYKFVLILLVGLAAISAARKDLNQFLALAHDVQAFADHWFGGVLPAAQTRTASTEACQAKERAIAATISDKFRWSGRVRQGRAIEIKGLIHIQAQPDTGTERITLGIPANLSAQVPKETFNGTISSEFPMSLTTLERHDWQWRVRTLIENSEWQY